MKDPTGGIDLDKLRRQAEQRLEAKRAAANVDTADTQKLLHELQVYQIELEMQNEELRNALGERDSALERYTSLYDFAPVAYFTLASDSMIVHANHAAARLLGMTRTDLQRQQFLKLIGEESRPVFNAFLEKTLASGCNESCELALQIDARSLWIMIEAMVEPSQNTCRAAVLDISERKQFERKLQLAAMIYTAVDDAIIVTDGDGRIVNVNPAYTRLTGYTEQESIGQDAKLLNSGRQDPAFYNSMTEKLRKSGHWEGEVYSRRKNGEIYLSWLRVNTHYDGNGNVLQRVAMFSDITSQKRAAENIWKQANYDPLTGLPNRHMFHDRLQLAVKQAQRDSLPMALMFLDLDRFKEVNDTLGHDVGDLLLVEAAQRLRRCLRETDTVARLGGDEFTVIMGTLEERLSIDRVAQSILQSLSMPFVLNGEMVSLTASIGITVYPSDTTEVDKLLKNADQAMYAAKDAGRNRYCYFTHAMQETAQSRPRLANELRGALAGHQFRVYYQPIVELANGSIRKAEALIRWQHPHRGLISPAEFIPVAEETGLIADIGAWVFYEAAQQVKNWRTLFDAQFQISINNSPAQFHNCFDYYQAWLDHLREIGLPGDSIVIEITEAMLMDVSSETSTKLYAFRDAGIQVFLDDFGTGYSSLSYLKKFDIDYLKIDRPFIRDLTSGSTDMALCEAIIAMAHKLGIKVIAEGIETEQHRQLLTAAGCDYGQGYLFSKPLPADDFAKLVWQ